MSRRRSPREADLFAELPPISYVWQTPIRRPRPAEWDIPDGAQSGRLTPEHLKSHLEYITRKGELTGETEQGALLVGRGGLKDLQNRWADDAALDDRRRRDGSLSVNIILSMPAGTDAAAVKDAARAFAIETFGHNHDYVFVQHLEDKHPHVHLTVRSLGHDGKRLNPRKADLQVWRERFAAELRLRGIAAEATPRRTRGRVRKADRGAVLALRKRNVIPYVDRRAREEVLWRVQNGKSGGRPWETQIQARQEGIRRSYLNYAAELERSGSSTDHALAREIREFVRDMPSIETRWQLLKKELAEFAESRRRDAARDTESPRRSESEKDERGK